MRIRSHLLLMAVAILLPIALGAGAALDKIQQEEREAALRGLGETVRAAALVVDGEIQASIAGLTALSQSEHLATGNLAAFYLQARALDKQPDVWTMLLDARGQQLMNTVVPFGRALPAATEIAAQQVGAVLASGRPAVTDVHVGPLTGKLITVVYVPVHAGGKSYAVAQSFAVEHWRRTTVTDRLPAGWILGVIDRQGKFVARSQRTQELVGQPARPELVQAAARKAEGLIRHTTLDGLDAYDAFTHSRLAGWTIAVAAPAALLEAPAQKAMRLALLGMVLAVGAAVLAMAVFGRRFAADVETAASAAIALGEGRAPRAHESRIQELAALNAALADAGRVLEQERESRRKAEAQREELLRRETEAREMAQAQNVAKDHFLAMLGHELRNPLAAISGATQLLRLGELPPQRTARYLDIIRRQNQHLAHIVNDLLDVSRLMAGKIELRRTPLELSRVLRACVEALNAADPASLHRVEVQAEPVWVDADPVRIDQVLHNLIGNAMKFSAADSAIRVVLRSEGGRAVVAVHDSGEGIAPELLPHVFEPFVQGPVPSHRVGSGLGIGLALVKQLVELHGGSVRAHSAGPGAGSVFSFSLPAVAAPGDYAEAVPERMPGGRRLLLVEDNVDARSTLADLMRGEGYTVAEVDTGEAALPAAASSQPDVVVLDIGLPGIDGYETARRLRALPGRRVPIIALSGYGQDAESRPEEDRLFDRRLVKPVDPGALGRAIEDVLAG